MDEKLIETLRQAQRFGFFGDGDIGAAVEHARGFTRAVGGGPVARLVDLGSGGGLPGLVLAHERPDTEIMLIDRRSKRTDFLERAVLRLGYDHVSVRCGDVAALCRDVDRGVVQPFDVVTARGFGPPDVTLRFGVSLMTTDGVVVISEPPAGDRWDRELLDQLDVVSARIGAVRTFRHPHDDHRHDDPPCDDLP